MQGRSSIGKGLQLWLEDGVLRGQCLCRHWVHSEMWWPRLFRHHGEIAWDDYEKDYSDLPREVLEPHGIAELERDVVRQLEGADKDRREILQVMASCRPVPLRIKLTATQGCLS